MAYMPHTPSDIEEMLRSIGAESLDELFRDIPSDLLLNDPLDIPAMKEFEAGNYLEERAERNRVYRPGKLFLGAGAYQHFIPAAVKALIQRGEFLTCYTPYQAEVSQGTLQAIYEFQTHIATLTGMEVANASMYDGASSTAEALLMAMRKTRKSIAYIPELLHPDYQKVCELYLSELDAEIRVIPAKNGRTDWAALKGKMEPAAAVVVQTPNALGGLEDGTQARELADEAGALLVGVCNPTALGVIAPPGEWGADIACGEAQPLGIPLAFGGPYAGYFATKEKLVRLMPGRLAGLTEDTSGQRGFVLTLQTREQHIRREKATSNICTNQGLFALMANMYMTFIGKQGLIEVAETCLVRTRRLVEKLIEKTDIELYDAEATYFHEAALRLPIPAADFLRMMKERHGIAAGWPVENWYPDIPRAEYLLLVCCTEVIRPADVEAYVHAARQVLSERTATQY